MKKIVKSLIMSVSLLTALCGCSEAESKGITAKDGYDYFVINNAVEVAKKGCNIIYSGSASSSAILYNGTDFRQLFTSGSEFPDDCYDTNTVYGDFGDFKGTDKYYALKNCRVITEENSIMFKVKQSTKEATEATLSSIKSVAYQLESGSIEESEYQTTLSKSVKMEALATSDFNLVYTSYTQLPSKQA